MMFMTRAAGVAGWLAVIILGAFAPAAGAQEKTRDFETLVSDVADAIRTSPGAATEIPKVRTFQFVERYSQPTELARVLSVRFAESLQTKANGFVILDPDGFRAALGKPTLPASWFSSAPAMRCIASELGATMLVEGSMRVVPDGVALDVAVWSAKARNFIFGESGIVPMTSSMEEFSRTPAPAAAPPDLSSHEERRWVNPEHPPVGDEQVVRFDHSQKGFTPPACVRCANPNFPDAAVREKLDGNIRLRVQILADGSLAKATLVDGLPCGLTDAAFEAVTHWTFRPARGPDGAPVAADAPMEVAFRFY